MFRIGTSNERPAAASTSSYPAGRTTINTSQTPATSAVRGDSALNRGGSTHRASELRALATDTPLSSGPSAAERKSDQEAIADAFKVLSISPGANKVAAANEACKAGDAKKMAAVQTLIKHRLLDANARLEDGNTLMHSIVMEAIDPSYDQSDRAGHLSIAKRITTLAELGADVSVNGERGFTPLHLAMVADDPLIVASLLAHQDNVRFRKNNGERLNMTHFSNDDGKTPLHLAAEAASDEQIVELLIEAGAEVDAGDNFDNRPLHYAASEGGDLDVVVALIKAGAHVDATNQDTLTPLHVAVCNERCDPRIMVALALGGADIDAPATNSGRTALHFASQHADADTVATLLELGADVDAIDLFGRSPLHEAAGRGEADIAITLLKAGAKANVKDREKLTPLSMAALHGFKNSDVAHVLKHFGAK